MMLMSDVSCSLQEREKQRTRLLRCICRVYNVSKSNSLANYCSLLVTNYNI